jgi:glycosyltransferase involved in cell wall biosynthesis
VYDLEIMSDQQCSIELSVVTATWARPQLLALCMYQFGQQSVGTLQCEHIVVSDGADDRARRLAEQHAARYIERSETGELWGRFAKDDGIAAARGEHICFWDDDNRYFPHALATLYAAAYGVDLGVVQVIHDDVNEHRPLPEPWSGTFEGGNIDTMCVCVRRKIARNVSWDIPADPQRGEDHRWILRLQQRGASVQFVPIIIGEHITAP